MFCSYSPKMELCSSSPYSSPMILCSSRDHETKKSSCCGGGGRSKKLSNVKSKKLSEVESKCDLQANLSEINIDKAYNEIISCLQIEGF